MSAEYCPSLEEFIEAPLADVASVAPTTMIYAPGGTRRAAALLDIEPWSPEFFQWAQTQIFATASLIFAHGIDYLILPALVPQNFKEKNRYHHLLLQWADWGIAGPEALTYYAKQGWRVRLLNDERVSDLAEVDERLRVNTAKDSKRVLYWTSVLDIEGLWEQLFLLGRTTTISTRTEALYHLYGEEIPPAQLYLAFGKPMVSSGLIPPLLFGQVECYWTQQPGYSLDQRQLRMILYDYAYTRNTWREEKLERAKAAVHHHNAWEKGPILGLGRQLGPFWYPVMPEAVV